MLPWQSYNTWNYIEKLQLYLQLWFKKGENNSWNDSSNPSTIDGKNCYKVAISWWLDWFFFLHVPSLSKCRLNANELHQGQSGWRSICAQNSINRLPDEKFQDVARHRNWLNIKRKEMFPRRSIHSGVSHYAQLKRGITPYPGWQPVKYSIHEKVPTLNLSACVQVNSLKYCWGWFDHVF